MHQRSCYQILKSDTRLYVNSVHREQDGVQGIYIEVFIQNGSKKYLLKNQFLKHAEVRAKGGLKAIRESLFEIHGRKEGSVT